MKKQNNQSQKSLLSLFCGAVGLFGCVAVITTDIVGIIVVESHNPISDTISALAIEKAAWIQDIGLDFYAAGIIACAVGLYRWNLGGKKWKIGTVLLGLLGIDIVLIAEHNQYAGRPGVGANIHIYCVYALAILFASSTLLLAFGLRKLARNWYLYSMGTAISWTVLAPIFFFVPTGIDGAYERFISLITIAWVAAISWLLIRKGKGKLLKKAV